MEAYDLADLLLLKVRQKMLPPKLRQAAEDAATDWTQGTIESLLPAPEITATHGIPKAVEKQKSLEVALKEHGGIFVVPVEINGAITLDFAVDSGASDVSVPADVFSTLVRTGTIKDSDVIGERTFVLADGSQSKSVTFKIRSLKVGDKLVENVNASVAPSKAVLLLGQSFLGRFKSWSLDNTKHVLRLNPQ
jgi:clan AA aspartic protease (TIGR02281 family)